MVKKHKLHSCLFGDRVVANGGESNHIYLYEALHNIALTFLPLLSASLPPPRVQARLQRQCPPLRRFAGPSFARATLHERAHARCATRAPAPDSNTSDVTERHEVRGGVLDTGWPTTSGSRSTPD